MLNRILNVCCILTLVMASASWAKQFPLGAYTTPNHKYFGGSWVMDFKNNGTYTVQRDGKVVVQGTYQVNGNEISFTDTGGSMSQPGTGVYKWHVNGSFMFFHVEHDLPQGRSAALTQGLWRLPGVVLESSSHTEGPSGSATLVFVLHPTDVNANGTPSHPVTEISLSHTQGVVYAVSVPAAQPLGTSEVQMRVAQGELFTQTGPDHPYPDEKTLSTWASPSSPNAYFAVAPLKFTWTGFMNVYMKVGSQEYWGRIHVNK